MSGTRRVPLRRPAVQPVSLHALELYAALRRAARARRRATDCTLTKDTPSNNCYDFDGWRGLIV